jgi:pyruvate dehydrogenase E2 component (dihydrolipoamide acetyltransferase)
VTTRVLLPQMGLEVSTATVIDVLVSVGDEVSEGQPLVEIETEKAITEVVAPRDGYVVALEVTEGEDVAVGAIIAYLGDRPDDAPDDRAKDDVEQPDGVARAAEEIGAMARRVQVEDRDSGRGAPRRAAPVARRKAAALGIALEEIEGTGPRGRITLRDVDRAAESLAVATESDNGAPTGATSRGPAPQGDLEPLTKVRLITARRMTQSQRVPQYELQRDVDATHLLAQKAAAAAAVTSGPRPGFNDLLIQAIARTVAEHRALATTFVEEPTVGLRRHAAIDVGLAAASDRGLMVPVIRNADALGLGGIAAERVRLVQAARAGRLAAGDMTGAVITLSNLASFGVDRFTAMLNPGESAIVAVGRVIDRVVPSGRGLAVVPIVTLTMTFDHRTVDGAVGGAALATLAELLEGRMSWRP